MLSWKGWKLQACYGRATRKASRPRVKTPMYERTSWYGGK